MEGSRPAAPAEPGTLKASLEATPGVTFDRRYNDNFCLASLSSYRSHHLSASACFQNLLVFQ